MNRSINMNSFTIYVLILLFLALLDIPGCGEASPAGRDDALSGKEAIARLPEEIASLLPSGLILCHEEERSDGDYRLWIVRSPDARLLEFPQRNRRGLEHHELPPTALESILRRRPTLDFGRPQGRCRFTHLPANDGGEIQIRELLTDQGWFASVEKVKF